MLSGYIKMIPELKMLKNRQLVTAVIVISVFFSGISASPLIIKGVDGTWLPVLASSWSEKSGGVMLKPAEGVELVKLRKKLIDMFPDMTIEIINKNLFFPSTNIEALFSMLNNVDIGIPVKTDSYSKETLDRPVRKSVDEFSAVKDELIEAVVENVVFEVEKGKLFLDVIITKRTKKGDFSKLYGKHRIAVAFKMTNGIADAEDERNKYFGPLLFSKKGTKISFLPQSQETDRTVIISRFMIGN
jgi:hypothetical protein